jgi:hypothetical protein
MAVMLVVCMAAVEIVDVRQMDNALVPTIGAMRVAVRLCCVVTHRATSLSR